MAILNTLQYLPVTIAVDEHLSASVAPGAAQVIGIMMPADWDAAALTFQASVDDENYQAVYVQAGTELSLTVAASRYILLTQPLILTAPYLRLQSGTGASPVTQTEERLFTLVLSKC